MKILTKIFKRITLHLRRAVKLGLKFIVKHKKIILWLCVPTVLMVLFELGKYLRKKLKEKKSWEKIQMVVE